MQSVHTADEALERFDLISGAGSPDDNRACVMTAISWMAGEAWNDHPQCAHRLLTSMVIRANDAEGTSKEQRAELVRAGATGLMDTWWVPDVVVLAEFAKQGRDAPYFDQVLATVRGVGAWKAGQHEKPDLSSANLRFANLRSADLRSADLRFADLRFADLSFADLSSADLSFADLSSADLRFADLRFADLRFADLSFADLSSADLSSANLSSGVTANSYTVWPNGFDAKAAGVVVV